MAAAAGAGSQTAGAHGAGAAAFLGAPSEVGSSAAGALV